MGLFCCALCGRVQRCFHPILLGDLAYFSQINYFSRCGPCARRVRTSTSKPTAFLQSLFPLRILSAVRLPNSADSALFAGSRTPYKSSTCVLSISLGDSTSTRLRQLTEVEVVVDFLAPIHRASALIGSLSPVSGDHQ